MKTPVLFVHYGDEWIRGSERALLDLLAHLDRDRFVPLVWCNARTMAEAVAGQGIPVHNTPMRLLLHWERPRFDVAAYRRQVRTGLALIRGHGARLVHAASGGPCQWMVPAARKAGIPLLVQLQAPYVLRDRCTLRLHQASLVLGVSSAVLDGLRADGVAPGRLRVVHNGVDLQRIARGDATGLRASLGIAPDEIVAACVGSLIHRKGFDLVLRAAALTPRVRFLVIGDGPDRAALQALAAGLGVGDRVHFMGEHPEVGAVMRDAADLFVLPSRQEAFGLAYVEAAAFGVPPIGAAVDGVPEVVTHEATGLLVPPEDPAALAAAIARLRDDPALRRTLGDAAREDVRRRFPLERVAADVHAAYHELMAHAPVRATRPALQPWLRLGTQYLRNRLVPRPA